jgi:hypothetical protein
MSNEVEKLRAPALHPGSMISFYKGMPLEPQVFVCEGLRRSHRKSACSKIQLMEASSGI